MGLKEMLVYLRHEGGNKNAAYFHPTEDKVEHLKQEILKRRHYQSPGITQKHLAKEERKKVVLSLNGVPLDEEGKTLADAGIAEGCVVTFVVTEKLLGIKKSEE